MTGATLKGQRKSLRNQDSANIPSACLERTTRAPLADSISRSLRCALGHWMRIPTIAAGDSD
jgi:hypothetical protein